MLLGNKMAACVKSQTLTNARSSQDLLMIALNARGSHQNKMTPSKGPPTAERSVNFPTVHQSLRVILCIS